MIDRKMSRIVLVLVFVLCQAVIAVDNDGDGFHVPADCHDGNSSIYPGAPEILCNGVDENCNGLSDDDINNDGDPVSFCSGDCDDNNSNRYPGNAEVLCNNFDENCNGNGDDDKNTDGDPVTFCNGDCNDNNFNIWPGNVETLCNGVDDNCNGLGDDDLNLDGDPVTFCSGDCDDNDPARYPGATEICDSVDNNCNGSVDEGITDDIDNDGFTICDGDCDDLDPAIYPGAPEVCDEIDNNCDGTIDNDCICLGPITPCDYDLPGDLNNDCYVDIIDFSIFSSNWLQCCPGPSCTLIDNDGDGYPPSQDCDECDPNVHVGMNEICNDGIDNNCDGQIDEEACECETHVQCDDNSLCTIDSCVAGACLYIEQQCIDDNNPCTTDLGCNPTTGLCETGFNNGAVCDDGDPCTNNDSCLNGSCQGSFACDDGNECTIDDCVPQSGQCIYSSVPIGDPCTGGLCNSNNECVECIDNSDCLSGQVCTDGDCGFPAS